MVEHAGFEPASSQSQIYSHGETMEFLMQPCDLGPIVVKYHRKYIEFWPASVQCQAGTSPASGFLPGKKAALDLIP